MTVTPGTRRVERPCTWGDDPCWCQPSCGVTTASLNGSHVGEATSRFPANWSCPGGLSGGCECPAAPAPPAPCSTTVQSVTGRRK